MYSLHLNSSFKKCSKIQDYNSNSIFNKCKYFSISHSNSRNSNLCHKILGPTILKTIITIIMDSFSSHHKCCNYNNNSFNFNFQIVCSKYRKSFLKIISHQMEISIIIIRRIGRLLVTSPNLKIMLLCRHKTLNNYRITMKI